MKQLLSIILLFALTFSILSSCVKDKVEATNNPYLNDTIPFNQTVLPLMLTNCATSGCHDAGTATSGFVFDDHASISDHADNALNAMRGNPVQMPFGADPLPDTLIWKFEAWILQGKQNN